MPTRAEIALILKLFWHDTGRNKKRIALTVLAIGWGTLSIVLLLSFGEGLKRAFHRGKNGMGEGGIGVVWPGSTSRPYKGLPSGRRVAFDDEDADLILARVPSIAALSREYSNFNPVAVGTKSVNARVRGVDPSFGDLRNIIPGSGGRFIDALDLERKRRVVVLGDQLAKDLFGEAPAVGRTVAINQSSFLVVGVMQPKVMMGMYSGPDKGQATIPASTFKSMFSDSRVDNFVYRPVSMDLGDRAKAEVYRVLARKYRFDPEDTRALGIWDTREDQRIVGNIALGIQLFLGMIGALTLFVGGMGVANIMYAVVKERTREIGIKMALGAKMRHVMAPFLIEALLMTTAGGVLGTTVALALMGIIAVLPLQGDAFDFLGRPTFSPAIALATAAILGAVGTMAGFFPARRAAGVEPAVSLRYE